MLFLYLESINWLVSVWTINAAYSHGFLVPMFAVYYLWANRASLSAGSWPASGDGLATGLMFIAVAMGLLLLGTYTRVRSVEASSMIPFLLGLTSVIYGRRGLSWVMPAFLFLAFMIPLPRPVAGLLSGSLQGLSTDASSFALQTLGIACFAEGNSIQMASSEIGIAEPCSGLRMLNSFFALTVGACLVIDRSRVEKILIAASAIPIAIISNCIRITSTGVICELFSPDTAQFIFHEIAGWLMVPLGFFLLSVELVLLDRLLVSEDPHAEISALSYERGR